MADKLLAEWFWTDRWMGSSAFLLPMEAQGVYRAMLTQAWRRGARLPNDHVQIQRATGATSDEWARCWPLIERFWRVDGESLVNDTQLEVYAEAHARQCRASTKGKLGARVREQKRQQQQLTGPEILAKVLPEIHPKQNPGSSQDTSQDEPEMKPPSLISTENTKEQYSQVPAAKAPAHVRQKSAETAQEKAPLSATADTIPSKIPSALNPARDFLNWFQAEYKARRNGAAYFVSWDKHMPIVGRLLKLHDPQRLRKHAQILLTTDEDWTATTDRGIEILASKINWLDDRLCQWEAKKKAREAV